MPSRFTRNPDRFARRESDLRPETYTSLLVVNLEGEILHLDGEGAPALFYGFSVGGERHTSLSDVLRRVPELENFLQQAFQGETATGEIRRWGKVWLASCRPLREEGRVVGAVCLLQDEHAWRERYFVPQAVTALSAALRKAATAAELQTVLFAQLQEWIPLDGGAVFLLPFEEHALNRYFGRWEQAAISASEEFNAWLRVMGQQLLSTAQVYYNAAQRIGEREAVVMGVPLLARSEAVGALWVEARSPLRAEERRLLETVGALVASALYRIQKYQQTEHRLQRLAALHAIERALTQTFDLSLSLQVLLEQLTRHFSIDAADVLFYDDQMHLLRRVAHLGFRAPLQEETLGVREGLPARVVRSRAQLVVNDLSRSPFVSPRLEALRKDEGFAAY
ncbi:MAG: GAF domain-containing protein, partial [Anaerolineae bacterium]